MSLDITLFIKIDTGGKEKLEVDLWDGNITHNLTKMAEEAGIYKAMWSPYEIPAKKAEDIIDIIEAGYTLLKDNPKYYKKFDSENGWGIYEHFLPFVGEYLDALKKHPKAEIYISK